MQGGEDDILCAITAVNRSTDRVAPLVVLPHLFFRNTWSWGYQRDRPWLRQVRVLSCSRSLCVLPHFESPSLGCGVV